MTSTASHPDRATPPALDPRRYGVLGRLGLAVTRHRRATLVVWGLVIVVLGVFAPRVESELSGAGWQADGSESVAVRDLAVDHFGGNASSAIQVVVHRPRGRRPHRGRRRGHRPRHRASSRATRGSAR